MDSTTIKLNSGSIPSAISFVEGEMENAGFSPNIIKENILVFEELMLLISSQNQDTDSVCYISFENKSRNATI